MQQEKKSLLIKYIACFSVALLITVGVFALSGFFTDNIGANIQIIADGFFVSGVLFLVFAGMMYISSEGALIGISFVLRNIVQAFLPMGRRNHEFYGQYRERKLAEKRIKATGDHCILVVGLFFLIVGIIFTVIWYHNFYDIIG